LEVIPLSIHTLPFDDIFNNISLINSATANGTIVLWWSELHIIVVGKLQLFTNALLPGWVNGHQFGEEVSSHWSFDHVDLMEWLSAVIAFHSSACSFNILTIILQHLVDFHVIIWYGFPVVNHAEEIQNTSIYQQLRCGESPPVCFPSDVSNGVFDEPR